MPIEIMTALIAAGIPAAVTVWTAKRAKRRVVELDAKVDNGLRSVVGEIHRELSLTVVPELAVARAGRESLDRRLGSVESKLDHHSTKLDEIDTRLTAHDEWEKSIKYVDELGRALDELADQGDDAGEIPPEHDPGR